LGHSILPLVEELIGDRNNNSESVIRELLDRRPQTADGAVCGLPSINS